MHALPHLILECIYTHLPFNDAAGFEWSARGNRAFDTLLSKLAAESIPLPPIVQSGASGKVLSNTQQGRDLMYGGGDKQGTEGSDPEAAPEAATTATRSGGGGAIGKGAAFDTAVCVGHALYGLSPFSSYYASGSVDRSNPETSKMQTVLFAVKSRLVHIMVHDGVAADFRGTGMSYGGKAAEGTAEHPVVLGVFPFGMGDGGRLAADGEVVTVVVRGVTLPVVATSLEYTTVDLTACPDVALDDEVLLMGDEAGITITEWAQWHGISPLEMLCSISGRLPSVIVE